MTGLEPFGWKEMTKKTDKFKAKFKQEVIETVLDSASEALVLQIKLFAPRSGKSRGTESYNNSIKVVHAEEGIRIVASDMFVTSLSTGKTYNLGVLLEHGTHAHIIEGNPLAWSGGKYGDGMHFAMKVHHPGTPPQPHFAPAIPIVRSMFPNLFNTAVIELWSES